jgi:hypothetical protein
VRSVRSSFTSAKVQILTAGVRLVKLRADAKHSRAPAHLRVARAKLRALLLLVYTNIAAALSPELVASIGTHVYLLFFFLVQKCKY